LLLGLYCTSMDFLKVRHSEDAAAATAVRDTAFSTCVGLLKGKYKQILLHSWMGGCELEHTCQSWINKADQVDASGGLCDRASLVKYMVQNFDRIYKRDSAH
jgi:hypothetical protein